MRFLGVNMTSKNFMKNCKGSHVGFIISFVIFVTFIIFLYGILGNIGKVEEDKDFLLKHIQEKIIEKTSEEVKIISINYSGQIGCLNLNGYELKKNYTMIQKNSLVKVYSSDELKNQSYECDEQNGKMVISKGNIGLIKKERYIFESKILDLNKSYVEDYSELKNEFNLPEINNFAFEFEDSEGEKIIESESENIPVSIFTEEIPIKYFNNTGRIKFGKLRVKVW